MSVSANYSSHSKITAKSAKNCQKCGKSVPTSRTTGDFCTDCFLNTNHKRFVATLGKAGIRKFERIIVPFDGDINSLTLFDHLKHHNAIAMPFPYSICNEINFSTQVLADNSVTASAIDISTVPKVKKVKKTEEDVVSLKNPEQYIPALPPTTTNDPSQVFPFYNITTSLNTNTDDMQCDTLYSHNFPNNIDPTSYLTTIPTISETSETYQYALSKLCDANKFSTQGQPPLLYRCFFIHVEGTFINTLLASNGQTPFLTTFQTNATPNQQSIIKRLNGTGCTFNSTSLPPQYPIVRLVDITTTLPTVSTTKNTSQSQRVLPYLYVTDETNQPQLIGSQLLSNITTLPVLSVPLESIIPDQLVSQIDTDRATAAITNYLAQNPATTISTTYYTFLLSKSYALYRLLTQHAIPTPTVWQKEHHSYFSSVIDFLQLLRRRVYLQCAIFTHSHTIFSTQTLEELSTAMISGLTKGQADSFLPRLVQWSEPIQPSSHITGSFVDTNAIQDYSYSAKRTISHIAPGLPLMPQVPIINVFSETPTKALFLHTFYSGRLTNIIAPKQPYLYWFPTEYNLASPLLSTSTKNADRVTANFISLLASMNDSSAANIIKTTDKLIPHRSVQHLHARFTQREEQMAHCNKNQQPRKSIPQGIAQFFLEDDEEDKQSPTDVVEAVAQIDEKNQTAKKPVPVPVSQKERPPAPILHYNNTSDGWYGDRCTLCGHIAPKTYLVPQAPVRIIITPQTDSDTTQPTASTQHMQNHLGFCSPCTLLIRDCDPEAIWMEAFVKK